MKNKHYIIKSSGNKYLCGLDKYSRDYDINKALAFSTIAEASEYKHLAGINSIAI